MPVSVKLDDEIKARIQRLADVRRRAPHYLMREAIQQYLEREEARESFKQEALAAWAEYQETGLHLSHEEMQQWLSRWGAEDEPQVPACHGSS